MTTLHSHLRYHTGAGLVMIALGAAITNYHLVTGGFGYTLFGFVLALLVRTGRIAR